MLFNSLAYLGFFPVVVLLYYILPWNRARNGWLLICSYLFYMSWDARYIFLILGCTVLTYLNGLFIGISRRETQENVPKEKRRTGAVKAYLFLSFTLVVLVLVWFKYADFLTESLSAVTTAVGIRLHIPKFNVTLPVGISFFTFQALGYNIDVYRGDVRAEKNFFRYALFIAFFPQLVAGPIERSGNLLKQFRDKHAFDASRVMQGLLMMLWGYFMKVVIADRAAIIVDHVYNYYPSYSGIVPVIATMLFAVQIYCDFNGYTTIAIGSARVMGFDLMKNFEQPYLAVSVSDFWRRWHISLTGWFRDYLYYPLGGNRKGKLRQYLNILIVFLVSGLWHGAAWTYVIWGGLNGTFQIIGRLLAPAKQKICRAARIHTASLGYRVIQGIITFLLVDFTWIFFRAPDIKTALKVMRQITAEWNPWALVDGTMYNLGMGAADLWVTLAAILLLFLVDILHEKGIRFSKAVLAQPFVVKWVLCGGALLAVFLFGVYGPGYDAAAFIYFQF